MLLLPNQVTPSHLDYQTLCVGYHVSVFRGPSGYQSLEICLPFCQVCEIANKVFKILAGGGNLFYTLKVGGGVMADFFLYKIKTLFIYLFFFFESPTKIYLSAPPHLNY